MDGGVKISLCKEDLAEVRINKRGSEFFPPFLLRVHIHLHFSFVYVGNFVRDGGKDVLLANFGDE